MPANLPPQYFETEKKLKTARTSEEKIAILEELLAIVPKHKGTENLRAQVKRKISLFKKEIQEQKLKKTGSSIGPKIFIEKEGDAQIVILGPTNVGRSSLLSILTNAKVAVLNYPYTTTEPTPGMFNFQDLQLQMVETPALMDGSSEGGAWGLQTLTSARNADGLILMVDLSQNPVEQFRLIIKELENIKGARVNKIYQPQSTELYFKFYKTGVGGLFLRIKSGLGLYLTKYTEEFPGKPMAFCMQLRKLLHNAVLREVIQRDFERIVELVFEKEKGYRLVCEVFGQGNFILTDSDYKILGVAHKREWKGRSLRKGEIYKYPKVHLPPERKREFEGLLKKKKVF